MVDYHDRTALHYASDIDASYDAIKMLVDVGGKDLIMAEDGEDRTALHNKDHTEAADKIGLFLDVGIVSVHLSTNDSNENRDTPLQIVMIQTKSFANFNVDRNKERRSSKITIKSVNNPTKRLQI